MKRKFSEASSRLRQRLCVGVLLAASIASITHAQDIDAKRFTLRGFGTVGATTQDTDGIEYRRTMGQAHGVAAGDVELYTDSIAGLQFNATLNPQFDAVLQGVTRQQADGSWRPQVSQAFLRYQPDESWVLRAGRVGYDIYLLAESRQVGYSYLALRPSPELYGLLTNDDVDGVDVAYTHRVGHGLLRARLFGGSGSGESALADGTHSGIDAKVYGACFDYLYRGWTARVALVRFSTDADPSLAELAAGLRMTGVPQSVALADSLDNPELTFEGIQAGIAYNDGPLQAQLLYGAIASDSIAGPETNTLYSMIGYRVHAFTPYVSYADSRDQGSTRFTGLPDIPMFAPLNDGVAAVQSVFRATQHTVSVGVRYDVSSHFDIKLQVDRVSLRDSSLMFDRRSPPGGPAQMTVVAAAVDFVF